MEDRYVVVSVDQNHVVDDGFFEAGAAMARAQAFYANSGVECYVARLVPLDLDKKPSLVILREQTAAIADTTTSTRTRTEQIYQELHALRQGLMEALEEMQKELAS